MKLLQGKKIMITGAASGIGKSTSFMLAEKGAFIVAVDKDEQRLDLIKKELVERNCLVLTIVVDLQVDNLESIFSYATNDGQKLDGLVHCAGISGVIPLKALTKSMLNYVMNVNFYSFIELVRQYSKKKYNNGGAIVGLSSLAAVSPRGYELAYTTSKAAMNAAIPCLAIELASKHIRVNGVMPGVVETEMIQRHQSEAQRLFVNNMVKKTLLGKAAPEDIASVVSFLLGDESRMITGRVIPVDGGMFL